MKLLIDFTYKKKLLNGVYNYFFQNAGKKITRIVNSSNLPSNIEKISIHLADNERSEKVFSGPIVEPRPGPTFAKEVAAADKDVTKSKLVVESRRVIVTKLKINIKKKLITEVVTSSSSF